MPSPVVNDIIEITWNQKLAGQMILSYFHYKVLAVAGAPDIGAFLTALSIQQQDAGGPVEDVYEFLSNELSLVSVKAQDIFPTRYAYRETFPAAAITGDVGTSSLPPGDTVCITKQGPFAGRHQHGTLHVAGYPVDVADHGLVEAGALANILISFEFLDNILTVDGVDMAPVIFNRDNPAGSIVFDHYTVEEEIRTMKRRVVGRGK